jgi:hypothetical protein
MWILACKGGYAYKEQGTVAQPDPSTKPSLLSHTQKKKKKKNPKLEFSLSIITTRINPRLKIPIN